MLFKQFWYRSGISQSITSDLKTIALEGAKEVGNEGTAIDIGCNDGTLMSFLPDSMVKVGFEPAYNVAVIAQKHGRVLVDYFNADWYLSMMEKAKLITAIAMFYDLEDPTRFCHDVSSCLEEDGVFIVQQNYLGLMLVNNAYDNICHEHLTYFSLASLKPILEKAGLEVYKVELNEVNGGSFKTFICHKGNRTIDDSVALLEQDEKAKDLAGRKIYRNFSYRVRTEARQMNIFLGDKKKVMIYGAGTRGATLFQYARMHHPFNVDAAVDNNPEKNGRYYLDTKIPIISREGALKNQPDYFLVLPYHIADEIVHRERESFPKTRFIIPLPEFRVV